MLFKKRIVSAFIAAVLVSATLLTACTTTGSKYPGSSEKGTAVVNIETEPGDLSTITTTDATALDVLRQVVDGLTILDKDDLATPGVAKDWTISEDGMTYTFNLRNDYKWSNGTPVTAKDFEFAMRALVDPNFAAEYAYLGYMFKNATAFAKGEVGVEELGVKAIDDYTFEIKLEYPVPYLPEMLAFGSFMPVNQEFYEAQGDTYATGHDKMLYNGCFTMTAWSHNSEIVLVKNPDYPRASEIKTEKVVMKMILETNSALNAFKSNELDVVGLNSEQLAGMKAEGQTTYNYNDGAVSYLSFNQNDPILKNAKIRKAIALAIDSDTMVKSVIANSSRAAASFTPPGIAGFEKDFNEECGPQFKIHDVETAKTLLAEGMKELGIDKVELSFVTDDSDTAGKYAAFIQENLKTDLGITVKIEQMPFKVRLERQSSKDFQVVMSLWGPDYNDPLTYLDMFETGGGNNHGSYSNPKYDELLDKARRELDQKQRFEYLKECEKILAEDMPVAPYYFRFKDYTVSEKVTGIVRTLFQPINMRWAVTK